LCVVKQLIFKDQKASNKVKEREREERKNLREKTYFLYIISKLSVSVETKG